MQLKKYKHSFLKKSSLWAVVIKPQKMHFKSENFPPLIHSSSVPKLYTILKMFLHFLCQDKVLSSMQVCILGEKLKTDKLE